MLPAVLNKRSASVNLSFLILMVLLSVITLVMAGYFAFVKDTSEDIFIDNSCRNSVKLHAFSHIKGVDKAVSDITCPTKYKTIRSSDDEKKKKALADELFSCWNNFHEGKYELFEDPMTYCSVCSVISFKDKKPITGFTEYLIEEDAPQNKGKYFDYLSSYSTEGALKFEDLQKTKGLEAINQETIDTNRDYAVVFVYAKGIDAMQRLYEFTIGNPGAFGSAVAGIGIVAIGIGAATSSTMIGSIVGAPIIAVGTTVVIAAGVADWITAKNIEPDWAAMIVLREYSREELSGLCDNIVE